MKIAFISSVYPYPEDNGKKVALSGFLRFLIEEEGVECLTFVKLGEPPAKADFRTIHMPLAPAWRRLVTVLLDAVVLRRRSLQEAFLFTPGLRDRLQYLVATEEFDLVIMDTVRVAQFFENGMRGGARWVLYMEDLFSRRYDLMLRALSQGLPVVNPLGTFAQMIPRPLRFLAGSQKVQSLLFHWERTCIGRREILLAAQAQSVCLVNSKEVSLVTERLDGGKVWETPPCLPLPAAGRDPGAWKSGVFVILGALDYQPNAVAALEFLTICMPMIARDLPWARIRIIGRGASAELKGAAAAWPEQCELVGFVDDISEILNSAAAMLVPVKVGSGPKLKTLQAMAHGLPLVTTPNGIEAIAIEDEVHCLVSAELSGFPSLMREVVGRSLNTAISERSAKFFRERYARDAAYPRYRRAFLGRT